jgi:hypothetical protein
MNNKKVEFLKNFNQAFIDKDLDFLSANITDDFYWEMVGHKVINGESGLRQELLNAKDDQVLNIEIEHIITHGNMASVNGMIKIKHVDKTTMYAFCDVYLLKGFKNPKVQNLKAYVIKMKEK